MLRDARKDPQLITSSWQKPRTWIEGVRLREVLHVPGNRGVLTEMFRPEWDPEGGPVAQIFNVRLYGGQISAWHCHLNAVDRLFALHGEVRIALYDDRAKSATRGLVNEFHIGEARPALLVVPPGVWHGVQNLRNDDAFLLNCPTDAYDYEDPDHWRVEADCPEIPYSWEGGATSVEPARPRRSSGGTRRRTRRGGR
jgi:dTDP-4-dehydrorhamnose 3,5-epimerase